MAAPFNIVGIDHVVLRAAAPTALERFYLDGLGLTFGSRQGELAQLRAGRALIHIVLADGQPVAPSSTPKWRPLPQKSNVSNRLGSRKRRAIDHTLVGEDGERLEKAERDLMVSSDAISPDIVTPTPSRLGVHHASLLPGPEKKAALRSRRRQSGP